MSQTTANSSMTGMSDAEFYGRSPASGADLDACRRAAMREVRRGLDAIIYGHARRGRLVIRRAAIRLALALGNQADAETYLGSQDSLRLPTVPDADELHDRGQLDMASGARDYPHPELAKTLAGIEAELAEARRAER